MVRRVNREVMVLLGWGRAILLQLAHPLVAAGVGDHTSFTGGAANYVRRTHQTVGSMLSLTFGSVAEVQDTAARINAIHRRVHGRLREATRRYPVGTVYRATDAALLGWVHTTLVETQLTTFELLVATLTPAERDQYCAEAAAVAPLLAIPDHVLPTSVAEVTRYLETRYGDHTVEVTDTARRLARQLLWPPGSAVTGPLMHLGRLVTIGLLPPAVRDSYGFAWDDRRQRRLARAARWLRRARSVLPAPFCVWPASRVGQYRSEN